LAKDIEMINIELAYSPVSIPTLSVIMYISVSRGIVAIVAIGGIAGIGIRQ
tara:strand:+ start:7684 stop:7836 length:153 start_codon:yes stop_codon:yes gene_type:complete